MSSCKNCQNLLSKYLDNSLEKSFSKDFSESEQTFITDHIKSCKSCKEDFDAIKSAKRSLSKIKSVDVPDFFETQFHMRLIESAAKQKKKKPFFFNFSLKQLIPVGAIAFAFFIIFSISVNYLSKNSSDVLISTSEATSGEPVTVEFDYIATKPLENVIVSIQLDKGISFHSDNPSIKSKRVITWKGNLKKGSNKIPFSVDINKVGTFEVFAKADYEGFSHKHKIVFDATSQKIVIAYYKLQKVKLNTL